MKILKKVTLLLIIVSLLTMFFGCVETEQGEKSITIILIDTDNTAEEFIEITDVEYLGEALDEMVLEGDISLEFEDSDFGRFVNSIGSLEPEEDQWISIYSDEDDPTLVAEEGEFTPIITYDEKEYKSTLAGIDAMPIFDDTTYVFAISG